MSTMSNEITLTVIGNVDRTSDAGGGCIQAKEQAPPPATSEFHH
jgi:hypothetical protein